MARQKKAEQKTSKGNTETHGLANIPNTEIHKTHIDSHNAHTTETMYPETMYHVKKTGIAEILVEEVIVTNNQVTKRELVSKDIIIIAKHKLWKAIYKLIERRDDHGKEGGSTGESSGERHRGAGISNEDESAHPESTPVGDVSSQGLPSSSGCNGDDREHDDSNKRPII